MFTAKVPAKSVDPVIREAVNVAVPVCDDESLNEKVPEPAVPAMVPVRTRPDGLHRDITAVVVRVPETALPVWVRSSCQSAF
ncbi:MAG: hypothetical protein Q7R41_08760, partial [Phycisphaerales bacterium]|nr:hypothetical protein [Phycisphaerales bacterium]